MFSISSRSACMRMYLFARSKSSHTSGASLPKHKRQRTPSKKSPEPPSPDSPGNAHNAHEASKPAKRLRNVKSDYKFGYSDRERKALFLQGINPDDEDEVDMKKIYGPCAHLSPTEATRWTPPPMAEGHRGRYLWTDAFGVLNFITLASLTTNPVYNTLADRLIDTVHGILGRTRDGMHRLPGATDEHPLAGGLRIGKEDEEDDPGGDGDGQYHHYLTIWMFALNRMSLAAKERRYNDLAIELAKAIHPRFVWDRDSPRPRMYWKMSIDMSRPMVQSEGNLDPIDGYVVYSLLQRSNKDDTYILAQEVSEYKKILDTKWRHYVSDDPLDLGMTLWTAHWFDGEEEWATQLTRRALTCLHALFDHGYFDEPVAYRLAFREFGTCMGIQCHLERHGGNAAPRESRYWEDCLEKVLSTWEPRVNASPPATREKLVPITMVMYCSALVPGAFAKGFFGEE
ncbi:uncharacterized protein LAESUDRAFT_758888 [Laetiporus sulphureus 93-53]|uniref:Uncharacterized protein n=1 Tax=Laetiporus sulphureus 93-53 TaxID=1314785 RepID=A0A165EHX4_9APHY|nr:uncharacterized protein LAESUDRAFT_758888 [Laetiporus sulphureus 93-53]KZT07084.1 hypothetical protein LAESUDRAFT_758888 [Laetiporus sulphureus 93-53]